MEPKCDLRPLCDHHCAVHKRWGHAVSVLTVEDDGAPAPSTRFKLPPASLKRSRGEVEDDEWVDTDLPRPPPRAPTESGGRTKETRVRCTL